MADERHLPQSPSLREYNISLSRFVSPEVSIKLFPSDVHKVASNETSMAEILAPDHRDPRFRVVVGDKR